MENIMPDNNTFKEIADKYGTPAFVFDVDELRDRAYKIKELLNSGTDRIGLCYSIKANPFIIPCISDIADMFEVCSPGELQICKSYNVNPEKIIYSGVHKENEDIRDAIEYGAAIITAESIRHYELVTHAAKELNKRVKLILRLSSKSQFGMSIEDVEYILGLNRDNDLISIEGLHYFTGTQRVKLKHQMDELAMLKGVITDLRVKFGLPLEWFEYGPGLSFPYFEGEDFSDTLRPLKELCNNLYEISKISNMTVEMGRFLASSCGYYISRVCDVKSSYDNTWCILDGGINHLNYLGQMMGMKTPVIITIRSDYNNALNNTSESEKNNTYKQSKNQTLCGSLCTTNDVIVRSFQGEDLNINDILVFCNTGAYSITEGLNLFLSRNMPVVLLYKDGIITKVRNETETWRLNS
jgi:diaminopimelate decarboxylase